MRTVYAPVAESLRFDVGWPTPAIGVTSTIVTGPRLHNLPTRGDKCLPAWLIPSVLLKVLGKST